ncbi:Outer membrane protein OmpA-like transmembrane domain-containing protein [Sphingomonas antarctica]|uniref:outer membrane protein n=1 Tax=Sphingomonas antarctica TaxID=2040274 RepID=UPI0039E8DB32
MRNLILAGAAAMAIAAPAFAQDSEARGGYDGFYVGGSFGGAVQPNDGGSILLFSRNGTTFSNGIPTAAGANAFSPGFCNGSATSTGNNACRNDKDGIEYKARIGGDTMFGKHIVVGFVGDLGKTRISDSTSGFSTTPASYTLTRSLKYDAGARGRVGFTPNGTTLFYGTGGVAYGKLRNNFTTSNTANTFVTNGSHDAWGYSAGGGVEQRIGAFSIGLEYLYTSLRDNDTRVAVGAGTAPATNPFILNGGGTTIARSDPNFRWHSMRVTAAFRF